MPAAILSTQDSIKLLEHLKSGFKETIEWKKYQLKLSAEAHNQFLYCLIGAIFQQANRLYASSF